MASNDGKNLKAKQKKTEIPVSGDIKISKKTVKKLKKSPLFILLVAFFAAGAVLGFFITDKNVEFSPLLMKVNGVVSEARDYAEIDLASLKETLAAGREDDSPITAEELAAAVDFYDAGVSASFFGTSLTDKITKRYLYRADLSEDCAEVEKIDFTVSGVYYIEYKCDHFAFGDKKIIKTIFVTGVENDG